MWHVATMIYFHTNRRTNVAGNFSCLIKTQGHKQSRILKKMVMSRKWCKIQILLLQIASKKWPIKFRYYDDPGWPSRSFIYCKPFPVQFFVLLCSSWRYFNWHSSSCIPAVIVNSVIVPLATALPLSKKIKVSHTRYQALGLELIPVYRTSARRWL